MTLFLRRHRVACFFVLAYFLTWGAIPGTASSPRGR